jgi:16S rRNA C1402 (ribose-2'-O) methylase RsmI
LADESGVYEIPSFSLDGDSEVRREMTKAHQAECVALTRDIRALLVERQVSSPMTLIVLINTLVAMIKHLRKKDTMEEAAEDLVHTLQQAILKSTN